MSHGGSAADYFALGNPIATYNDYVIKNYPKKGLLSVTTYHGKKFIYSEPIVEKNGNWKKAALPSWATTVGRLLVPSDNAAGMYGMQKTSLFQKVHGN